MSGSFGKEYRKINLHFVCILKENAELCLYIVRTNVEAFGLFIGSNLNLIQF